MDSDLVKVEAASTDGYLTATNSNWNTARGASTGGTGVGDTDTSAAYLEIKAVLSGGNYIIRRSFLHFSFTSYDCSDISSINLYAGGIASYIGDKVIVIKSTAFDDALSAADFDALDISTTYSNTSGHTLIEDSNIIALNASAIADAKVNKALQIAIVDFTHDYSNSAPSDTSSVSRIASADGVAPYVIINGAYATKEATPAKFIDKDEFVINRYDSDVFGRQFARNGDQTTFRLGIPGVPNLRARNTSYKVTKA